MFGEIKTSERITDRFVDQELKWLFDLRVGDLEREEALRRRRQQATTGFDPDARL